MNQMKRKLIAAVVKSLETCPEDWSTPDRYTTVHKSGVYVWVANSYYGVAVGMHDSQYSSGAWSGLSELAGGVGPASSILGFLIPWRRRLYKLATRPSNRAVEQNIAQAINKVAA